MILRHFHIFAHSSAHTPRMSAGFALLFALLLGTLPLNARLVLRHGDQVLSPADTVRITVVEQRTEYPSDDPANPDPFTVVDFKYPDLTSYTVGTDKSLNAPLDFSALVENVSDFSLQWCGLTHECNFLSARGDHETRNARLTAEKPRLPLELEGHFEANRYGHAVARLTLTPTAPAEAPTTYVVRFTYSAPSALRRVAAPLAPTTPLYDLAGRRVVRPLPGHIYLRAGRKFVAE
jgi:hypothetical protein